MFDHTDKILSIPPNPTRESKYIKYLGLKGLQSYLHKLPEYVVGVVGVLAMYYNYRQRYQQEYLTSEAFYKLTKLQDIDAGNQFMYGRSQNRKEPVRYSLYYRMPDPEFNVMYRLRSSFITGQFDHDKEILMANKQGNVDGYDVITPFYYYYSSCPDKEHKQITGSGKEEEQFLAERAAMAVHRGWIPAELKDRRTRPYDINSNTLETIYGTLKKPQKKSYEFKNPNDPTNKLWFNFCLEDFAYYWDIPNVSDAKYIYFKELNFRNLSKTQSKDVYPLKTSLDQLVIENGKEIGVKLDRSYKAFQYFWGFGSGFMGLCFMLSF